MKREVGDYIEDIISAMGKAIDFVKSIYWTALPSSNKSPLLPPSRHTKRQCPDSGHHS